MVAMTSLRRIAHFLPQSSSMYRVLAQRAPNACIIVASRNCQTMPKPSADDQPKEYPEKIVNIVDNISQLTILEVADLNELLKARLNISDAPMAMAAMPQAAPAASQEPAEEEEVQTEFTVKLMKFDDASKVKLIKEIKALVDGMNLVQAKKFVESTPQVIKKNISKEEAEQLKKTLETAGGSIVIE